MVMLRIGKTIILGTFVFWLVYTAAFGFNAEPENSLEAHLDHITLLSFKVGLVLYFIPLVGLYESSVKNKEENKPKRKSDD